MRKRIIEADESYVFIEDTPTNTITIVGGEEVLTTTDDAVWKKLKNNRKNHGKVKSIIGETTK